ncbi:MAG: hypothetical protein LIP18_04585 [Planctomycetes bacterium]|nr:hypothetical protein [Planctomycetota bacterium]
MSTVVVPGRGGGVPPTEPPALPAEAKGIPGRCVAVVPCPMARPTAFGFDPRAVAPGVFTDDGVYGVRSVEPGEMTALYGAGTCRGAYGGLLRVGRCVDIGIGRVSAFARSVAVHMLRCVPLDGETVSAVLPVGTISEYNPPASQADSHRAHASTRLCRTHLDTRSFFRQRQAKPRIKRSAA